MFYVNGWFHLHLLVESHSFFGFCLLDSITAVLVGFIGWYRWRRSCCVQRTKTRHLIDHDGNEMYSSVRFEIIRFNSKIGVYCERKGTIVCKQFCCTLHVQRCSADDAVSFKKEFKKELECEQAVYTSFVRHIGDKIFEIANLWRIILTWKLFLNS